jgi:hypothetical protein
MEDKMKDFIKNLFTPYYKIILWIVLIGFIIADFYLNSNISRGIVVGAVVGFVVGAIVSYRKKNAK